MRAVGIRCSSFSLIEMFFGHHAVAAKRPQRQLFERRSARVLPLQRSETVHGRKRFLSANEATFEDLCQMMRR
jgi:hypothetical protein